jgi:transcriptional regulator GlxA family with amidase domain
MNSLRHIAILAFDGIQILDVTGPAAVFSAANDAAGFEAYQVHLLSAHGGPIISNGAVTIATDAPAAQARSGGDGGAVVRSMTQC